MSLSPIRHASRSFGSVIKLRLLKVTERPTRRNGSISALLLRSLQTDDIQPAKIASFRQQLKESTKLRPHAGESSVPEVDEELLAALSKWKLTVGIEVHAQLNTERKLFSRSPLQWSHEPNTNVTFFDEALPGSQPIFQKATLLPALRAALALNCKIQCKSRFDRKHYFYQDQPAGYQITQYYEPFAKDGYLMLYDHDGIAPEDGPVIKVGIKQIQMEQDTAKTTLQPPYTNLLDFNRVGHPLIEIITLPHIHHPQTAAACVRKIQSILQSVNAVTTGMEMGGLRADVNVSIAPNGPVGKHGQSYAGVTGLGQRTEIKNLSSFKAIEDAVVAERNHQIGVVESGETVKGETRGWTLGSTRTSRLRGKEGEVDYRYMPDPDIAPVLISEDLIDHLTTTLPATPDRSVDELLESFFLTSKVAKILATADDGLRLDYFHAAASKLHVAALSIERRKDVYRILANWTTQEIGALLTRSETPFSDWPVRPAQFAALITILYDGRITGPSAKSLLTKMFDRDPRSVETMIKEENLELEVLPREFYTDLAAKLAADHPSVVETIQKGQKGAHGKLQFLIGQMVRSGQGKVEAKRAEEALKQVLGGKR